ncbi:MAG: histidine phosphatase family protein [Planctomycetota bacterium]|nr:MAG: histidine phosphatase family protein [Planctomycetota bacterium]
MSSETMVYLARHGATDHNLAVPIRLQGNAIDGDLAAIGIEQARGLSERLASLPIRAVYSSVMRRACQTAAIVAEPHQLTAQPVEGLHEIAVGQWEGLSWAEIQSRHPEAFAAFFANPAESPYLGGECYEDVLRRARPVLHQIIERHVGQAVVIVTHNVVNRVLLANCLGLPLVRAKFLHQSNCCFNELRCAPGITDVRSINQDAHVWPWIRPAAGFRSPL